MESSELDRLEREIRCLGDESNPVGVEAGDVRVLITEVRRLRHENKVLHDVLEASGTIVEEELEKHLGPRITRIQVALRTLMDRTMDTHRLAEAAYSALRGEE